jgi:hypothetical protein
MISRRTTRFIGELFQQTFCEYIQIPKNLNGRDLSYYTINGNYLYDFLYDNDYAGDFCNEAKLLHSTRETRKLKEFIMRLHTGESLDRSTNNWSIEQREKLGQRYLKDLTEDILNYWSKRTDEYGYKNRMETINELNRSLELDGYEYKNNQLLYLETEVLDVEEETGLLQSLYNSLTLGNHETAFHHLKLSEEHYIAGKWDDSISNSRKFFESVLQEVAAKHSSASNGIALQESVYSRPFKVRDYLERENLLETKEKETISSVYGLLSHTGGHPYMAQNDQARLLRHLALTFSQFVMLRLKGKLGI